MNYKTAILKRNIELAGMFPFVLLGKIAGRIFKLKTRHRIFLFFPWADIGGSIKVNADIATCIKNERPLIIFTKKPRNNEFRHLFEIEGVRVLDIHKYVDNKALHFLNFFFRGVLASWINAVENPVVFGGESMYFYKIVPHVKKETRVVELCHLNNWFNFSQSFIKYIDFRIFSSPQIKRDMENLYKKSNVPVKYYQQLYFVDNMIEVPELVEVKNDKLEVVFVGRGAAQKRVHLIAAIAKRLHEAGSNVHFSFVGDVEEIVPDDVKQYCTLYGNVKDKNRVSEIYQKSDVLILTSLFEGLPIVVMEMMARGKVILSTAVGGIPDYIEGNKNGLLITETNEDDIVAKGVEKIQLLIENEPLRKQLGIEAYAYAKNHFSGEVFCKTYKKFFGLVG